MTRLQIYDPRERALVGAADRALALAGAISTVLRRRRPPQALRRILLLRLERIGDLLMTLPAIADARALAPSAEIDLVVGSWNLPIARAIPSVNRVEALDPSWLAREHDGLDFVRLVRHAWGWRARRYDIAIDFEPDIRSVLLLAAAGARWTAGFASGGGGPLLDVAIDYDPRAHTTDNARRLVTSAFGARPRDSSRPPLRVPESAERAAAARLAAAARGPLVAVHVAGGRPIKQWEPDRFAAVARRLVESHGATIVLTGSASDRPLVEHVKAALPTRHVVDVAGDVDLLVLAALLTRVDLLVTGDTGPMHIAAAVGTPVVAVFGPSDPIRYGPRGARDTVVQVDLPCSPCNRIRLPPGRCTGHTPDCLALLSTDRVYEAAVSALEALRAGHTRRARTAHT
jgi:lipopolysaccharide heptosyltransferase II